MNIFDNVSLKDIEMCATKEDEPEYDSPNGSRWIVGVADDGTVSILSFPFIHDSFFDCGKTAEELGLPIEVEDAPGVYEWICNIQMHTDRETGYVDDWEFYMVESKLLYTWPDNGKTD